MAGYGQAAGRSGATINVGVVTPTAAINPITIADQGGIECIDQVGEFLVFTDRQLKYHPWPTKLNSWY